MISEYARVLDEKPKLGYEFQLMLTSQKGVSGELCKDAVMNVLRLEGVEWYEIDDERDLQYAETHLKLE